MPNKQKTTEWFINKAKLIYDNKFDYSKSIYTSSKNTIEIGCKIHGSFFQRSDAHFKGKGCPLCNRRIDLNEFLKRAYLIHGEKYNYSQVIIANGIENSIISIICPVHGIFDQLAKNHILKKHGCQKCGTIKKGITRRKTKEIFIDKATEKHNGIYDYSKVDYIIGAKKIEIICLKHGSFWQTPSNHLNKKQKQGCPKCANNQSKTTDEFINHARMIHNNTYDYSLVEYNSSHKIIEIYCKRHGKFIQSPSNHLAGKGCPNCAHRISKPETNWLDFLCVPDEFRQKYLQMSSGKRYEVDAYVPSINTVYEFYGDYWHGNPIKFNSADIHPVIKLTYGELYQKTLNKEKELKKMVIPLSVFGKVNLDYFKSKYISGYSRPKNLTR